MDFNNQQSSEILSFLSEKIDLILININKRGITSPLLQKELLSNSEFCRYNQGESIKTDKIGFVLSGSISVTYETITMFQLNRKGDLVGDIQFINKNDKYVYVANSLVEIIYLNFQTILQNDIDSKTIYSWISRSLADKINMISFNQRKLVICSSARNLFYDQTNHRLLELLLLTEDTMELIRAFSSERFHPIIDPMFADLKNVEKVIRRKISFSEISDDKLWEVQDLIEAVLENNKTLMEKIGKKLLLMMEL